ncbi:MAG: NUDIX hydrolase [Leptolyngbya sp.]|nr:NUDIX hydrolase [Candidatus Melainabacteria bacterium]
MSKNLANARDTSNYESVSDQSEWLYWNVEKTEFIADCKIFEVNKILATSKCGQEKSGNFFTLDCGSWVNVIPLTEQNDVIMVEQYRHGIQALTLEIPGGSVEVSDGDAGVAALRELREETGCEADRCTFLGKNYPNPALQNNFCFTYLAEAVRQVETPKFDGTGTERICIRKVKLSEIPTLIRIGTINHALVIAAFHFLTLERPELFLS